MGPGGVELPPGRSEEVQGSLEPHSGGLRALEEAWMMTFCLRLFSVKSGRFLCSRGASRWCRRCRAASKEVSGGQGKPKAPERWLESSGRGLDDDFLFESFFCQVWGEREFTTCPALPCLALPCLGLPRLALPCLQTRKSLWWLARLTSSHQPSSFDVKSQILVLIDVKTGGKPSTRYRQDNS